MGDGHGVRGVSPGLRVLRTGYESSVLDCFGAGGCGGGWICVRVASDGFGTAVLEVSRDCGDFGIGILVD